MSIKNTLAFMSSLALAESLASCGAGTAAIFGASDDGGGTTNSGPALTGFAVIGARAPETCNLRFVLADAESDRADVALFYELAGGVPQPVEQVSAAQLTGLATAPQGIVHAFAWNFPAEPGLPDDAHYLAGVRVYAQLAGVATEVDLDTNAALVALGNDAPVLAVDEPTAPEQTGIVPQRFTLSDSASDLVSVRVEYDVVGDDPDLGWRLARPGGVEGEATPDPAIPGVETSPQGVELVFFWDTQFDLGDVDRDVRLRFTALDDWDAAAPKLSASFRIDNNSPPIASIGEAELLLNPDGTRGIPIPYEVFDEEGDEVRVVFQWRGPDESYPELPESRAEIEAILADPVARREHRICTPYPSYLGGQAIVLDSTHVRLPELASTASTLVARGIVGREIEFLRPANRFEDVTEGWSSNPLQHPVAALPTDSGIAALVLDVPGSGSWRLRELELSTGEVLRTIASSNAGAPSAMVWERGGSAALIASDVGGAWTLERVPLDGSGAQALFTWDGTVDGGPIRGLASLGTNAALVTVGSSLVRADWTDPSAPFAATLLADLAEPWGLALDPLNEGRVYLAEHAAQVPGGVGRVLSIDLDLHDRKRVRAVEEPWSASGLPAPRALAVERDGARLLALCDKAGADAPLVLCGVGIGRVPGVEPFVLATSASRWTSLATDTGRLAVDAAAARLFAAGGSFARSRVASYEPVTGAVGLAQPLEQVPQAVGWRILDGEDRLPSAYSGGGRFVWDARESAGDSVFMRQVPYDEHRGLESQACCPRTVGSLWSSTLTLGSESAQHVACADLDGDGDLDIACVVAGERLAVFFQTAPGAFGPEPVQLGGPSETGDPRELVAADLDGDGRLDLASANGTSNNLTVFRQVQPGAFATEPIVLGGPGITDGPRSLAAADLDGDGRLDLANANGTGNNLTVFLQRRDGSFDPEPIVLGDVTLTDRPRWILAADLDRDGDRDLASANFDDDTITVFWQEAPGTFDPSPLILGDGSAVGPSRAADLDGDGDLDLATAWGDVRYFRQVAPGSFDPDPVVVAELRYPFGASSVHAADVDGDGDLDLVVEIVSFPDPSRLAVFLQVSPGIFDPQPLAAGDPAADGSLQSPVAADLDGDGDQDLVACSPTGIRVLAQTSPGTYTGESVAIESPAGGAFPSLVAADLDSDGDLDLGCTDFAGTLNLFLQARPGVFAADPITLGGKPETVGAMFLVAADLDGDLDLDLASANRIASTLTVFLQTSPGGFAESPIVLGGTRITYSPSSIAAGDLDGDGDLELVSTNFGSDDLTIFEQVSPGAFGAEPIVLGGPELIEGPWSLVVVDLDGDSDLDLASANSVGNNLTVFWQTSTGAFDPEPAYLGGSATTPIPRAIIAFDVDGDGDLDLASANVTGPTLTVFRQVSPGTFDPDPLVLGGPGTLVNPQSLVAADLDGDGDLDLASPDSSANKVAIFWQLAPAIFDPLPTYVFGLGHQAISAADVDGDGDLDLALANLGGLELFLARE